MADLECGIVLRIKIFVVFFSQKNDPIKSCISYLYEQVQKRREPHFKIRREMYPKNCTFRECNIFPKLKEQKNLYFFF